MNLSTTAGNETIKPSKNKRKPVKVVAEEDSSDNEDGNCSHACERIMQLFERAESDVPEGGGGRSQKMQTQLKKDRVKALLQTFEEQLNIHASKLQDKVKSLIEINSGKAE